MVTIKDIAKKANTSIFTVSSVINNKKNVSSKLRKRVLRAIDELNYIPNAFAAGLKSNRSFLIGLIVSDIEDIFFPQVIKGIEDNCYKAGFNILLSNTRNDLETEIKYIRLMIQNKVDGLLIFPVNTDKKKYSILFNKNIPTVFIDREIESLDISSVLSDDYNASYNATNYLIDKGHTNIGFVSYPPTITTGRERLRGYKDALIRNGIQLDDKIIKIYKGYKKEDGFQKTNDILNLGKNMPTALLTATDLLFTGAFEAINIRGLKIPEDISIITFHDLEYFKYLSPSITSICIQTTKIGNKASELLIDMIHSNVFSCQKIKLNTIFIERESVKNLKE